MTRSQRIAIWVLVLVGLLVTWKLFGQGFGNFRADQPFLARNYPQALSLTLFNSYSNNTVADYTINATYPWKGRDIPGSGESYDVTNSYTIRQVDVWLKKNGSPASDIRVEIWSDNAAAATPNALLGYSDNVPASAVGGGYGWVSFTNLSVTITTNYWVVCHVLSNPAPGSYDWGVGSRTAIPIRSPDSITWDYPFSLGLLYQVWGTIP